MQVQAIGKRLQEIRARRTRKEFAALYGVHEQSLFRYEKTGREPDKQFLSRVLSGEGIEENWLLTGNGRKYKKIAPEAPTTTDQVDAEVRYLTMLLQTKDERLALYEKLVQAHEREIDTLRGQVNDLKAEIAELKARPSLSAEEKLKSA